MRNKKAAGLIAALPLLACVCFIHHGRAQNSAVSPGVETSSPDRAEPPQQIQSADQNAQIGIKDSDTVALLRQLTELLAPLDVKVEAAKLIDVAAVPTARMVHIKWKAYEDAPEFVEPDTKKFPAGREFTVVDRKKVKGPVQRQRFVAITGDLLFIAAVNEDKQLLWWGQIRDPRVLRSEWAQPTGESAGVKFHLSVPSVFVEVPDVKEIKELKFYMMKWAEGKSYLELISSVPF